jgi:hypothetical protein
MSATSASAAAATEQSCDAAAAKAESDWNLPAGILSAVGAVESGRAGPRGTAPWPWTINAAGHGTYHETKEDAVATVLTIMARGFPYIDVGCFQVDLAYHAGVFRSLDEAFDPDHNAQAAARILLTQRVNSSDWGTAVARYHSATPELGSAYLERVRRALPSARLRVLSAQDDAVVEQAAAQITVPPTAPKLPTVIYARPATGSRIEPQMVRIGTHLPQHAPAPLPQLRAMAQ